MRAIAHRVFAKFALLGLIGLFALTSGLVASPVAQAWGTVTHNMTIVAHDNGSSSHFRGSFSLPSSVHAGGVKVTLINKGAAEHMAQFFKLKPGVSESRMIHKLSELFAAKTPAATAQKLRELLAITTAYGGADGEQPGARETVIEHLTPGRYVVVCLETTPQGVPHFELGMTAQFTVSGSDHFVAPASNGTIVETDHVIRLPSVIHKSRPLTLRINVSSQTHELQIASVPAGTTRDEILACLQNPPGSPKCKLKAPPEDVTGASGLFPGGHHWIKLDLKPGTYVALCFVPDIHTGLPHALMGMVTVFVVK